MSILDQFRLDGKTALVTGARRGIGRAWLSRWPRPAPTSSAQVRNSSRAAARWPREVERLGRTFRGYACDLADRKAVYAFIEAVKRECPPIDILINNAGTILRKPAEEHPDEYWDRILEVNLNAQFVLAREFGRDMLKRGAGKIVFTASLLSFQGGITVPGYAAAKGGVAQLTKALANEWAGRNVQVNAIAPGYIATDNTAALQGDPARNPAILARIPAGPLGRPRRPRRGRDLPGLAGLRLRERHGADGGWRLDGAVAQSCWPARRNGRQRGLRYPIVRWRRRYRAPRFQVALFHQLGEDLFERRQVHQVAQALHRIRGHDAALVDDDHLRADLLHHLQHVRDVEYHLAPARQFVEQVFEEQRAGHVDAGERLVQDQHVGIVQQRGGDQDALLHALGVGRDGRVAVRVQREEFQQIVRLAAPLPRGGMPRKRPINCRYSRPVR